MHLAPIRLEAVAHDPGEPERAWSAPFVTGSPATLGPIEVAVVETGDGFAWSAANRGDRPLEIRSVSVVFSVETSTAPLRIFRHGYQSWSPTGVATLGIDVDPSSHLDLPFLQAVHHADQRTAPADELRSEWVTVIADATGGAQLVGFDGGGDHDGTFRLRAVGNPGGAELVAEAFLGDALFAPGERRDLHGLELFTGDAGRASQLLAAWAQRLGSRAGARTHAPYQVGWCSWYHYFYGVTEASFAANLANSTEWPFELFQLDDGYQAAIGDWLTTNDSFPSGIEAVASSVTAAGRTPGIWLAPFIVAPDSDTARRHPDWVARHEAAEGGPLRTWWNPDWNGGDEGFVHGLDTTNPEVLAHLENVARELVSAGFRYLKLDFTFSPSADGIWHDPSRTPAQRVRAGFEAIRRGAGDDTFLLGCGVPLSPVVGIVDGTRIGQDVAPLWAIDPADAIVPGYADIEPATKHAYANTVARAFMHRNLWLNDPDCVMLRTTETKLSTEAARTWARTIGVSGGMALVSDDLALLGSDAQHLLDELLVLGRASDARAASGAAPTVPDLLEHQLPTRLEAGSVALTVDPRTGSSTLTGA